MAEISIILPVYNVEKYLKQCLDSIVNQTFKDFECICVNDGSTDNSLEILQSYADKDNRFKIINQQNKGLSGARNTGLNAVNSKYIAFIDSDDFISEYYLEKLYECAEKNNSDIVYCFHKSYYDIDNSYKEIKGKDKIIKLINKVKSCNNKNLLLKSLLSLVESSRSACWRLYKTKIIKDNVISFFEELRAQEDYVFNILFAMYSLNNVCLVNEELYFYRKQMEGLTSNRDKMAVNGINSLILLTKDMEQRKLLKDNKILINFVCNGFFNKIGKKFSYEQQKNIFPTVLEHLEYLEKNICKNNLFIKIKLKFIVFIMDILKVKSFILFRILKNFYRNQY